MSVRLYILRHAKSDWPTPPMPDIERPLNKRGRMEAPTMGTYMAKNNYRPSRILSSPSIRTRQTLEGWRTGFGKEAATIPVTFDENIYEASAETLLERIRGVPADVTSLMLVGHNPGCEMLARSLVSMTSVSDPIVMKLHTSEFATAALACIQFDGQSFADIAKGAGKLLDFKVPSEVRQARL